MISLYSSWVATDLIINGGDAGRDFHDTTPLPMNCNVLAMDPVTEDSWIFHDTTPLPMNCNRS
jgi:hypothetical protein